MTHILSIPIEARLAVLFVLGCCVGAAINLGIYRLAWSWRSISPWSRPDTAAPPRRFSDRLPVIGWLGLRREAALHGPGFWIRPMLLELLTGAVFALLYWWEVVRCGLVPTYVLTPIGILDPANIALPTIRHEQYLAHIVLFCFMLVAFWIDVDEWTIPDGVTIPGTLLGLVIVTMWPYALLPESPLIPNGPFGRSMLSSVWLTSPDDAPPRLGDPIDMPRYVQPWDVPACTGRTALAAAIGAFWAWCLALLPRPRFYSRHGLARMMRITLARMFRNRIITIAVLGMAVLGSLAIAKVWSIGGPHWAGLGSGLAGIVIGGGLVWLVRVLAGMALHQEAMGFGDVTLLAMIGAFLGWQAAVVVFFLAPFAALVIGVARMILRGTKLIPYGPFLCLAAVVTVLAWPTIWEYSDRYFSLHAWLIAVLVGCLGSMVVLLPLVRWFLGRFQARRS